MVNLKQNILQKNPKKIYKGSHYAITGNGGFEINTTSEMQLKPVTQFGKYDLTNTLQIIMDKEIFNSKIGEFDNSSQSFLNDKIRLETEEFMLIENQIISLGALETMYIDFKQYIYDYLKMSYAVNIFNEEIGIVFEKEDLCKMIRENAFSGYIEIIEIHKILQKLVEYDICGNRENGQEMKDGFMNGDIFYIPNGLSIMLSLECDLKQIYKFDISIRLYDKK
jgi:hypothetical protein